MTQSKTAPRAQENRREALIKKIKRDKYLLAMLLPVLLYYVIFHYIPMTGAIIAFKDFKPGGGIYNGEWVGLRWFIQFFDSPYAYRTIRNTVLLSLYSLIFGFPIPILFAICVTEIGNSKIRRTVQTVSYLPHFISTVVLVGMITNLFTMNNGVVNGIINALGGKTVNFLQNPGWFRTLYVGSGVWQSFGFNSIIYIAAINGIDPSLYEAAKIDGIRKYQQVLYITLPMISSTIVILFILQLGKLMSVGFEKVFLMYSPAVYETADVISTYVYRKGIESSSYSFASAVGLFNSVVNFLFVYVANCICRKATQTSLW
ncbi:MAG: sugar ABC transporter permease [Provencibacterium sp.]|jgi:putative aldouronate transport system permease protein|nr:sugar ABC transporter permease [Provencibacterium sp.]